jgi:FkbM family methyltransferase
MRSAIPASSWAEPRAPIPPGRPGLRTARAVIRELAAAWRITRDRQSFARLAVDIVLYRVLRLIDLPRLNSARLIRLRPDVKLLYRLNRGDILALRETWIHEAYKLPFDVVPDTVVDLGANIGLTSVWLANRYGCSTLIAVEPLPENVRLLRANLKMNRIAAEVFEAAVGASDDVAPFEPSKDSTAGRLGSAGVDVRVISMTSLLESLAPGSRVDLLKLDIEGGEQALLEGDSDWLEQVRSMIVEFHPKLVDYVGLVHTLEREGFRYIAAGSVHSGSMDGFIRANDRDRV